MYDQKTKIAMSTGNDGIGLATDEQTIRDFLSGTECLKGVCKTFNSLQCFKYIHISDHSFRLGERTLISDKQDSEER